MDRRADETGGDHQRRRVRWDRQTRLTHDDGVAVGVRVRVYPGSDAETGGVVVDDFELPRPRHGVDIGNNHGAGPTRRWAVMLDAGELVFVDTADLTADESPWSP